MGRRAWALTAILVVVAVGCGTVAVVAAQQRSDAQQRRDEAEATIAEAASDLDTLRSQVAEHQATLSDLDARAQRVHSMFTPDVLTAVSQVQVEAIAGACDTARTAIRNGTTLPAGDAAAAYAAATAPAAHDILNGLPARWGRMIDPTALQAEIDRCAADEQAITDAEAARAALDTCDGFLASVQNAGRPPTSGEVQYLFINCGIDIAQPPPGTREGIDGLLDDCLAGNQAVCDGLAAEHTRAWRVNPAGLAAVGASRQEAELTAARCC